MTVKAFTTLQKISTSNECFAFELSINQSIWIKISISEGFLKHLRTLKAREITSENSSLTIDD